jgi:diaminohydroxyphosphoribosylaminopyrimidine deaminase / 5-amino-6-(5-phosphoribosylamino)uracil reductase
VLYLAKVCRAFSSLFVPPLPLFPFAPAEITLMRRALELAALGGAATRPNPLVGCVIADAVSHQIVAEGWHQQYGGPHAEVNAVAALPPGTDLRGLRVFVTLEPCAHHGKTPPCADLLIRHGATEVVVAILDPNPLVAGQGVERLRAAGCAVRIGLLEAEARWQNRRFLMMQTHRRPWVVLKWAQSADGQLADAQRQPVAITGELTRRLVHRWRTEEAAILVGANTARTDDPRLDARQWPGPNPVRVVLAGKQPLPTTLRMFTDGGAAPLVYGTGTALAALPPPVTGIELPQPTEAALAFLLHDLHRRGLQSVLVEGGSAVLTSFLQAGFGDEIRVLTNPHLKLPNGVSAPPIPAHFTAYASAPVGTDTVHYYRR